MEKKGLSGSESLVGSGSGTPTADYTLNNKPSFDSNPYQTMVKNLKINDAVKNQASVKTDLAMAHAQLTGATEQIQTADAKLWLGLDPKLSSTNVTCNQLVETLKQPTQTQQERTGEAAFLTDKRVKRLIKKTQKAIEGAESEQLFLSQSKKRKAPTLPLPAKPTRLILRIPLLEKRGAEMATDGVEGKENKVLDNCKQESRMAMRNEAEEREERGKEGGKILRSKLILRIPLLEKRGAEMATDGVEGKENKVPDNCKQESRIAMRNEAGEREEREKEREKILRSKLILRIPLLEKRGAEMATDGVEGKENKVPDNCKQESRMTMRNEAREREERGKEGEKILRSKLVWNPVPEVDITPNYCILPVEPSLTGTLLVCHAIEKNRYTSCVPWHRKDQDMEPPSTNQTDLERSVLNDRVRLVHRHTNYHRELNHHEKVLLHNEDMRFELDMFLEIVRSTIKQVEIWINDMNCGLGKPMESYFSAGNKRCIEKLYGDQGLEMMGMVQQKPDAALPIILARLKHKLEEVENYHIDVSRIILNV